MANKTSLIVTSTDQTGKQSAKTFTNVSPKASAADLKTFAQGLVSLTSNTYDNAALVERTECDIPENKLPFAPVTVSILNGNNVAKTHNYPDDFTADNPDNMYQAWIDLYTNQAGVTHDTEKGVYKIDLQINVSNCGGFYPRPTGEPDPTYPNNSIDLAPSTLNYNPGGKYLNATFEFPDDKWKNNGTDEYCQYDPHVDIGAGRNSRPWEFFIYMNKAQ